MKQIFAVIFVFSLMLPSLSRGQHFFRIKADFTIKEKSVDGKESLSMGQVYYDKSVKKLLYKMKFPEKATWLMMDSTVIEIAGDSIKSKVNSPMLTDFSIFHLSLNGGISDFGLKSTLYKIDKVERDENLIITTWIPPTKFANLLGKIVLSQKDRKLYGVIFYSPKNVILAKQIFRNYSNTKGLAFPSEIVQITYINNVEQYQITTYKNILVDDLSENSMYNFALPH